MQNLETIVNLIAESLAVNPTAVVKKKYGKLPEYTFKDIAIRLISTQETSIAKVFPEMASRSTITRMLNSTFPGKTLRAQHWDTYILLLINKKKCSKCINILDTSEFYASSREGFSNICKSCESNRHKQGYLVNKSVINLRNKRYYIDNRDKVRLQYKEYYNSHKAEFKASSLKRFLRTRIATPSWASMNIMNQIYADRPIGYHVDHIIPLQGTNVCGLHCEHNLQYLTASENLAKGNKFDSDNYIHILP